MASTPGFVEAKRKEIRNMKIDTEKLEYTKIMVEDGLELAEKDDADSQIVGNAYVSKFMREQVLILMI